MSSQFVLLLSFSWLLLAVAVVAAVAVVGSIVSTSMMDFVQGDLKIFDLHLSVAEARLLPALEFRLLAASFEKVHQCAF